MTKLGLSRARRWLRRNIRTLGTSDRIFLALFTLPFYDVPTYRAIWDTSVILLLQITIILRLCLMAATNYLAWTHSMIAKHECVAMWILLQNSVLDSKLSENIQKLRRRALRIFSRDNFYHSILSCYKNSLLSLEIHQISFHNLEDDFIP